MTTMDDHPLWTKGLNDLDRDDLVKVMEAHGIPYRRGGGCDEFRRIIAANLFTLTVKV